ncbi:protease modulator HflC [Rhodovibrionaceae bacterium A322]
MNNKFLLPLAVLVLIGGVLLYSATFIVRQTEQAIVLQFGEFKWAETTPGLKFKMPFIQDVLYYERRVLNLDPPTQRVLLSDQKPLLVNAYARYRIVDALRFFQRVRSEANAETRLDTIVNATMRGVLGNVNLTAVLSDERVKIMQDIQTQVNAEAERLGIAIVDVRIRRADLPDETSEAVYNRMKTEREREAAEFRAQGFEMSQSIKASADREATVIQAEAEKEAEILRGDGDAARTTILADAYGKDPSFFEFYRSMQAYDSALDGDKSLLVLPPDSDFFKYFNKVDQ